MFRRMEENKEKEQSKFDVNMSDSLDTNIHPPNSQTIAAERFQEISSPYSVAALLAAAELDEELSSHGDEPN